MTISPGAVSARLDDIAEPAWVWDIDRGRIVNANTAALDLYAEPSVTDLMDREFDEALCSILSAEALGLGSEPLSRVLPLFISGGARDLDCRLAAYALNDGRSGVLVTVLGDASPITSAETQRLAMAAQNAPTALLVLDTEGHVLSENKASESLFGQGAQADLAQRLGSKKQAVQMIEEVLVLGQAGRTAKVQTRFGPRLARLTARRGQEPTSGKSTILIQVIDVQDQRAREDALHTENEALQDFLNAGSAFVLEMDSDLRLVRLSKALENHLGESDHLGMHWRELISEHGFAPSNDIELAMGARSGWQDKDLTLSREGEETRYISNARVLTSDLGDFRGYRIVAREWAEAYEGNAPAAQITHLQDLQSFQSRQREQDQEVTNDFASILEAAPWAVVIQRDFVPLYINIAFCELLGMHDDHMNKPGDLDLLSYFPQAEEALSADYDQLMEDDMAFAVRDLNVRRKDGELIQGQLRARLIEWGGKPAVEYIIEDVSIQQRIRRAHETRAEIMSTLLDVVPEAVFLLDTLGAVEWTNEGARNLLGLTDKSPLPHDMSDILAPEDADWTKDYIAGLGEGGLTSLFAEGREVCVINAKGEVVPALLALDRVEIGSAVKISAVLRNLSDWKQTQVDLVEIRGEAENASARKTEFLASVSHELRTPLTAILGFAEVMSKEELGPMGNARYLEYARDIVNSGDHLLSLINDLLDMSKVETGNLDLTFASVDLQEVTDHCVKLMSSVAQGREINLHAVMPEVLSPVVADERSMRQIILNLISNALRFTEPGGEVQVSLESDASGALTLLVADTGVGMSEEELAIALEPFEQVQKAVANGTPGTGLGLPLARALTEANRAYFRIISEPQTGTTVAITFPSTQVLAEQ